MMCIDAQVTSHSHHKDVKFKSGQAVIKKLVSATNAATNCIRWLLSPTISYKSEVENLCKRF